MLMQSRLVMGESGFEWDDLGKRKGKIRMIFKEGCY